jgi:hypothetical protein
VVHSDQVGLVVHVVHAVLVVNVPLKQHELHEQLSPPWLNVPLKQPELHEQLKPSELNVMRV